MSDFLAIISLTGGGGSYARDKDRQKAISRVCRTFREDWKGLLKLPKGKEIKVVVADVSGHDQVWWDDMGIFAGSPEQGRSTPITNYEVVKTTL